MIDFKGSRYPKDVILYVSSFMSVALFLIVI
jgi:hypothetical protein